jgi:hypothetical protein
LVAQSAADGACDCFDESHVVDCLIVDCLIVGVIPRRWLSLSKLPPNEALAEPRKARFLPKAKMPPEEKEYEN